VLQSEVAPGTWIQRVESASAPHGCIPKKFPVEGKTSGVVLLLTAKPVDGFDSGPEDVAVIEYPFAPLVLTSNSCAAILLSFVPAPGTLARLPSPTSVAVEAIPVFVSSTWPQPVFPEFTAALSPTPEMINVRLGSIDARTVTDSTVPIAIVELSSGLLLPSVEEIPTLQTSAVPDAAVLVGFMRVGICVVQEDPVIAEHPINTDIAVPTGWLAPVVSVIVGIPLVDIVTAAPLQAVVGKHNTLPTIRLLKENVVAEGVAVLRPVPG